MTDGGIPDEIRRLADARADARASRDWAEADRLRAQLEAAGWRVVDRGFSYRLAPSHAPDVERDGILRYGRVASVPSRLEDLPVGLATVVLIATDWPADLDRTLAGLAVHARDGTDVVVVADGPSIAQERALAALDPAIASSTMATGLPIEVVRTSERLGYGSALDIGVRRARASVVIVIDTSVEPTGDVAGPLVAALQEPTVAIAGGWGLVGPDLRALGAAPADQVDVDVVDGAVMAFRRADFRALGPIDERFRLAASADVWWSLVLREGAGEAAPRRAVQVGDLPTTRHDRREDPSLSDADRARLRKRAFYRVLDRFGRRPDLVGQAG